MSEGIEHACVRLFEDLKAEFPDLTLHINPHDPNVEVSAAAPSQPGLGFDLHLNLQNRDELHLQAGEEFWCSWFPASDPEVVQRYRQAVSGLISGRYRILEYVRWGRVVGSDLQAPEGAGWTTIAKSRTGVLPVSWGATTRVVRNERAV